MASSPTHRRKRSTSLLGLGGVALADILANSVAVILILIAVTLSVQEQHAQEELEKSTNITTLLSRQLSTTLVYNDLPSSPPAQLHDYHACTIEHDCNPMRYPVIEMLNGHIRIFNTNTRIYRRALLRQDNALDTYLRSLDTDQRNHIRLDVHAVSEYYLTMAILQENNVNVHHWHYLGESVPPLKNNAFEQHDDQPPEQPTDTDNDTADQQAGQPGSGQTGAEQTNDNPPGDSKSSATAQFLASTQQADAQTLDTLQYDTLLPPRFEAAQSAFGKRPSSPFFNSGEPQAPNNGQQKPGTLFEALIGMVAGSGGPRSGGPWSGGNGQKGGDRRTENVQGTLRLNVPNAELLETNSADQNSQRIELTPLQYRQTIITYLLKLLEVARTEKTLQLPSAPEWLAFYALDTDNVTNFPHRNLVDRLAQQISAQIAHRHPPLKDTLLTTTASQNQLRLDTNTVLPSATLELHQPTPWLQPLSQAEQVQPGFLLRLYPSLFKGERLEVPKGYTLLIHPDEFTHPHTQWRPIAVFDAQLNDISLGFVHAGLEGQQLLLSAGVNQLRLNKLPVANPLLSERDHGHRLLAWVWLLAFVGIVLLLFRYRLRVRRQRQ